MYYPGRISNASLSIARVSSTTVWDWAQSLQYDQDITSHYHDSLAGHLLHSLSDGIHTSVVLWGDSSWVSGLANAEVHRLVDKCVAVIRSPLAETHGNLKLFKCVLSTHIYDCGTGTFHDVLRREIVSADTGTLKHLLPAADNRCVLIVRLTLNVNEWQSTASILVPPPYDDSTYDVHSTLRAHTEETLLSVNSLVAVVLHLTTPRPPHDEVLLTVQKMKLRACAPIPNTQSAAYLTQQLLQRGIAIGSASASGDNVPHRAEQNAKRVDELLEELRAMEGELVSVRAAFLLTSQKCSALEAALNRTEPELARPLMLDPAAVQRENLRVAEELLRKLNVDYVDLERRVIAIEGTAGETVDAKLRRVLKWRQQESEILLRRLCETPTYIVNTQLPGGVIPIAGAAGGASYSAGRGAAAVSSLRSGGLPSADNTPAISVGRHYSTDPVTQVYQARLVELENEVSRLIDVDVKACIDEYYVQELARSDAELATWMARCRLAEELRDSLEAALRAK